MKKFTWDLKVFISNWDYGVCVVDDFVLMEDEKGVCRCLSVCRYVDKSVNCPYIEICCNKTWRIHDKASNFNIYKIFKPFYFYKSSKNRSMSWFLLTINCSMSSTTKKKLKRKNQNNFKWHYSIIFWRALRKAKELF